MRIIEGSVRRESIPLATPFATALRRVEEVEFILLELRTDNGLRAFGSAPATKAITGETCESIARVLRSNIVPALLGHPFSLAGLLEKSAASVTGNPSAQAAADMALHSLAAQARNVPLYRFLGGRDPQPVKTAVTISLDAPETMTVKAGQRYDAGFDILKIKVGGRDGRDTERIRKIAAALPHATLLIDANQAWDVAEALDIIGRCGDLRLALIEQPVAAPDLDGLREITRHSPFPILADEAVFDADDAERVLDLGAADLVNIKLMKCGGIAGALKIIEVCRKRGKQCMLGSMLEGPVSITAALHLAAAFPDVFAWIDLDSPLLYRALPADLPFEIAGNVYRL